MLRVLELFAGIGACSKALERLGIEHKIVDAVEIDKYAIKSFNAVHGTDFEPQDITKWNKDIDVDLIMHGSPCQDFSVAGKGAGGDEGSGTRSSLLYETLRIVDSLRPKYVIWENVKNLLSKKHVHNWNAYAERMEEMGYTNYCQVMNAKDYGVPQNRERVFTVSIRETILKAKFLPSGETIERPEKFVFPEPIPLEKKLKDVLETEVDEKYYLTDKTMKTYCRDFGSKGKMLDKEKHSSTLTASMGGGGANVPIIVDGKLDIKGQDQIKRVYDTSGVSPTLSTMQGGNRQPKVIEEPTPLQREVCDKAIEKGLVMPNDAIEYTYSNARLKEIENGYIRKQNKTNNQVMSTLKTNPQQIDVCVEDPFIVASRGRGENNEQQLEPRSDGVTNTLTSVQKDNYVAIKTANKTGYDLATDGDDIDLAYPDSKTRRGRVGHEMAKTLPTSDSQGVLLKKGDNDAENQRNTEILPILRKEIGEKTFQEWAIGGLWCILSEAVLWERVYAPSVYKNWIEQPKLVKFAYFGKNNKPTVSTQESVRNMWIGWQDRCSSYRRELPEQLSREFTSFVQELPHEVASWQKFVQDLRKASEGLGVLRQALSEIQEIWQPDARWEVQRSSMRIRKLTPLSCWRLMGFDDTDFRKAEKVNSNTQLYKQAGNSIVVNVLEAILANLLRGYYDK